MNTDSAARGAVALSSHDEGIGAAGVGASLASRIDPAVSAFASDIGTSGPVTVVGARTHWHVGGEVDPKAREVGAPTGIWEHEPSEMTVRCGAGTSVAELSAHLASSSQMVPFDPADDQATVGGVLACGFSGPRRLRYGHVRDLVLQTRHVDACGKVVTSGGPTVKNVSGYDLARLLVGSLGTLGLLAEVILRTLPLPAASQWVAGDVDPFAAFDLLYRPSSILWDGTRTWILLEGDPADVSAEAAKIAPLGFGAVSSGPLVPAAGRESMRTSDLSALKGSGGQWLAEVGVGLVHRTEPVPAAAVSAPNAALMSKLKQRLDPQNRLNPGRKAW